MRSGWTQAGMSEAPLLLLLLLLLIVDVLHVVAVLQLVWAPLVAPGTADGDMVHAGRSRLGNKAKV